MIRMNIWYYIVYYLSEIFPRGALLFYLERSKIIPAIGDMVSVNACGSSWTFALLGFFFRLLTLEASNALYESSLLHNDVRTPSFRHTRSKSVFWVTCHCFLDIFSHSSQQLPVFLPYGFFPHVNTLLLASVPCSQNRSYFGYFLFMKHFGSLTIGTQNGKMKR